MSHVSEAHPISKNNFSYSPEGKYKINKGSEISDFQMLEKPKAIFPPTFSWVDIKF
jgi:hypothetical protein